MSISCGWAGGNCNLNTALQQTRKVNFLDFKVRPSFRLSRLNPAVRVIRPIHLFSAFHEEAIRALALASASPGLIDYPLLVIRKPDAAETLKLSNRVCC